MKTDLSAYNNHPYHPGGNVIKRLLWFYVNALIFKTSLLPSSRIKCNLLRLFGAKVGEGVVIKPCVNIKYPWFLSVGDHSWIGEQVWIDCLTQVTIGSHVCLSQGALLLTGNHDYRRPAFNLMTRPIILEDGVWICAKATVCPGITAGSHAVLFTGAVAMVNLEPYSIYQGNPATKLRTRRISE